MTYLLDTDLSNNKTIITELTKVFGLGKSHAKNLCNKLGLCSNLAVRDLTPQQQKKLFLLLAELNISVNAELIQTKNRTKSKLIKIKSYRGLRKLKGYPVRGQRTRSNAKTSRKVNR